MIDLKPGAHIHLIGICGTAMASLAAMLQEKGFKVTGSDQNVYPPMSTFLQNKGIAILHGYKKENLASRPDYVVVGNVISRTFEEAQALLAADIPYGSMPETLRDVFIGDRHSVVICGTHGKTTTTSMVAWVATQAQLRPGFFIGGIAKNFSSSYQVPAGEWFVVEGDEYDTAFWAKVPKFVFYKPEIAVLGSIEFDHGDIYKDLSAVEAAFKQLLTALKPNGLLVHGAECSSIAKILPHYPGKKISFGFQRGEWTARDLRTTRTGIHFAIFHGETKEAQIFLPMFGTYNALNALAAYIIAKEMGWSVDVPRALAEFQGVKRRQELIGEPNNIQVFEDFAHHPTAVAATLASFKRREGAKKLIAIFEPRSATSRRDYFYQDYLAALRHADHVFIARPYDADKLGGAALDTARLANELVAGGTQAVEFTTVDEELLAAIKSASAPGDTIVIMSNGGFQGIYSQLLRSLAD